MIVLVTGGRDYPNRQAVFATLDEMHAETPITKIVHGACTSKVRPWEVRGADRWAQEWALVNEVAYAGYPAQWSVYRNAAGPVRNSEMLRSHPIDAVVGFPGNRGTQDMCDKAERAGVPVHRVSE